ncbi:MAG: DUF432 domain-containing protein [Nitrososphaera sp.]
MAELFGHYRINLDTTSTEISIEGSKMRFDTSRSSIVYSRAIGTEYAAQATILTDKEQAVIGVFPVPPLFTPKQVATNLYLKFKYPVIVDQRSEVVVYAKMPIEIGVFRQSDDEELLIDAFSPTPQRYALYGSPESGVVCRYAESETSATKEDVEPEKYREALVRIRIRNDIDNIVRVSKVIIPMDNIILDHAHDEAWLPGSAEMALDSAFGKDIVNVRLIDAKVKRIDKTSLIKREETRTFRMDGGY